MQGELAEVSVPPGFAAALFRVWVSALPRPCLPSGPFARQGAVGDPLVVAPAEGAPLRDHCPSAISEQLGDCVGQGCRGVVRRGKVLPVWAGVPSVPQPEVRWIPPGFRFQAAGGRLAAGGGSRNPEGGCLRRACAHSLYSRSVLTAPSGANLCASGPRRWLLAYPCIFTPLPAFQKSLRSLQSIFGSSKDLCVWMACETAASPLPRDVDTPTPGPA